MEINIYATFFTHNHIPRPQEEEKNLSCGSGEKIGWEFEEEG
jgi:hypothetical protein